MRLDRFQRKRPGNVPLSSALKSDEESHLELSIHEIFRYRVGPALWTYRGCSDKPDLDDLEPLRSPTDTLGITFDKNCIIQMKLLAMEFDDVRYHHLLIGEAEPLHLHSRMASGVS